MVACTCNVGYLKSVSAILKIAEMVCVSVALGVFRGVPVTFGDGSKEFPVAIGTDADFFAGGVMVASLLVTPVLFFLCLAGFMRLQQTVLELAINFLLGSFLFISGSVGMGFWHNPPSYWSQHKSAGLSMSGVCYVAAVLYMLDSVWACKTYCSRRGQAGAAASESSA